MTDLILVGRGLAASVLMHQLHRQGLSFTCIGQPSLSTCSQVAGGIWNPVVFKRMTQSWMAAQLIQNLDEFYSRCEALTGQKIIYRRGIAKPFAETQEKALWLKKAANELEEFLDAEIHTAGDEDLGGCNIRNEYGLVKQSGYIDMPVFLESTASFFAPHMVSQVFDHSQLKIHDGSVSYKDYEARSIVFCEGFLVKDNPLFDWIPLKPAKGEVLTVKSDALALHHTIFNRNGFMVRLANGHFKVGATYAWNDLEQSPTEGGRQELEQKLAQLTDGTTHIIEHRAGIRPSSIDRRPIIGPHPQHKHVFVFNGLGTKGVMLAPFFAENFVLCYVQKAELNPEVNVKRFYRLYENQQKK